MKKVLMKEKSRILFMLVFFIPTLVAYIAFFCSPIFTSLYTSFFKWSGFSTMEFLGLKNYSMILKDPIFYKAIKNDLMFVLGKEILIVPLTVLFAVALTRMRLKKVEAAVYRYLFYIPNILSISIIAIMWAFVYDPYMGLLNGFLEIVGLEHLIPADGWLVAHTMPAVTVVASWCGIGFYLIILISAINSIPKDLYEAAEVDGAGQWRQLIDITFPCVWGQIKFIVLNIVIGTLGNYALVMALANGGVNGSGMVMGLYVYQYGIDSMRPQVGYANAAAVMLLILTSAITLLLNKIMTRGEDD